MSHSTYWLLIFVSLVASVRSSELQTLLNLKSALKKSNTTVFRSWEFNNSACNFTGITCNSDGSVKEIQLSNQNLTGNLPFDSICKLQSLDKLSFGFNFLRGSITKDLNYCVKLRYLDLGNNLFSGTFPDISSLSQLRYLRLNNSGLSGNFPWKSLGNMTTLVELNLEDNLFDSTPFPTEVLMLKELTVLHLRNCSIKGKIPSEIGNLTSLIDLQLAYNHNISGEISAEIGKLQNLLHLNLQNNSLTGKLPTTLSNLTKLESFDTSKNFLEGDLSTLRFLTNLVSLSAFENEFHGEIPAEFGQFKKLQTLLLFENRLTGPLPRDLGSWARTTYIDVHNNFLAGPIPPGMCKKGTLRGFSLSVNKFTGEIPATYSHCKTLKVFMVNNNSLSGVVPAGIWGLPNAAIIDLSLNQFEGPISSDIKNAKALQYLHAGNNRISGELPEEIFQSRSLVVIDLYENQISGKILCSGGQNHAMSSLEVLNLAYNNVSGALPSCLGIFPSLSVVDLRKNKFQGTIPPTFAEGCPIKVFDLCANKLEGPVPRSLSNCRNLEVLDLGNNMVNDTFPHWLDTLPNLQVLLLHSNKFHGFMRAPIANHSFSKLRILDVSNNTFVGPLPTGYMKNLEAMMNVDANESVQPYMKGRDYSYNSYYYYSHSYTSFYYFYQCYFSVNQTIKGTEIEIPRILATFTSIDLSHNRFEGEIPEVVGKLHLLRGLNLAHNFLTGRIPPSIASLTNLEWLDLSSTKLVGEIPTQLADLTFLSFLNLSQNQLVGPIPRGNQFNTFEKDSYKGNPGLCGFPLAKSCNNEEPRQPPPSTFQSDDDSGLADGFGWKVVLIGYGCGTIFGIAMGYLVFQTGKPGWFVAMVEDIGHKKVARKKKTKAIGGGRYLPR